MFLLQALDFPSLYFVRKNDYVLQNKSLLYSLKKEF